MAYHITLVVNKSTSSIAITNPANEGDSMLVGPVDFSENNPYKPQRPILVNKIGGNPTYTEAITEAINIYTSSDNYCFWDNENSSVNGIGQNNGDKIVFNMSAGNLEITITPDGELIFSSASAEAAAV
jgi:hypothetical protein